MQLSDEALKTFGKPKPRAGRTATTASRLKRYYAPERTN